MRTFVHRPRPTAPRTVEAAPTRLAVSAPGDRYEREASLVADAAMRAPRPGVAEHQSSESLTPPERAAHADAIPSALRSAGEPLHPSLRAQAQAQLGFDFSHVRVHADSTAAESAEALGAAAYTHGRHIVFGAGAFRPATPNGQRLLTHELAHVVQQTAPAPAARAARASRAPDGEGGPEERQTRAPGLGPALRLAEPMIQRDLAIEPPRPRAVGRELTEAQMQAAIAYNERVIGAVGVGVLSEVRDVLGVSPEPAVVDEEFVNAVVRWQAMYGLGQDGRLGAGTAAPLFREIGAEGVGRGQVKTGPTYTPTGTITAATAGGRKSATFRMSAEFEEDPENGIFPSCCEVEQWIRWDAAAVASWGGPTEPHAGFPVGTAAGTWIEDRDVPGFRYGRRSGPRSDPGPSDQYLDPAGRRNQAFGARYTGRDTPNGPATDLGTWRFMLQVVDVCNGRARIGDRDFVRVDW